MTLRVSALRIYPLKGARGLALDAADLEPRGLAGDRRLVAADPDGMFLTQRDCGALARVSALWREGDALHLRSDDFPESVDVRIEAGERRSVTVWRDRIDAVSLSAEADAFLTRALGRPARLFHMDAAARRTTSDRFAPPAPVSFADGYPVLIATEASLQALNAEIAREGGAPIGMERFRPNIVIAGSDSWAEDRWASLSIGDVVLDLVKPCERCAVTTMDQQTGVVAGKEPLKTLARLRRSADPRIAGVLFGWNVIPRRTGRLTVGQEARVVAERPMAHGE